MDEHERRIRRMTRRDALWGIAATGVAGELSIDRLPLVGASLSAQVPAAQIFALIGDRYHNSDHYRTAFGKTIARDMGITVDFSDEVTLLTTEHLSKYRILIILRDGINWPDGHGNPQSNAGWWSQGQSPIVSDPPLPAPDARSQPWMRRTSRSSTTTFAM